MAVLFLQLRNPVFLGVWEQTSTRRPTRPQPLRQTTQPLRGRGRATILCTFPQSGKNMHGTFNFQM